MVACRSKSLFCVNALWQVGQRKGFSPVVAAVEAGCITIKAEEEEDGAAAEAAGASPESLSPPKVTGIAWN